jgi:AcrR family transcriptional regulator
MRFTQDSVSTPNKAIQIAGNATPVRRRMSTADRRRQIIDGAIQFFAKHGLDGQLRNLTKELGITHALLYHYFPTKDALIKQVYEEVFESRWKPEWETLLDNNKLSPEEKLNAFYIDYSGTVLTHDLVRILIFSGLSDRTISDRFFEMLRSRLIPRLIRETRKYCQRSTRAKPSHRELEHLMGLHGGIFYIAIRRWIYGQAIYDASSPNTEQEVIRDRVDSYLLAAKTLFTN